VTHSPAIPNLHDAVLERIEIDWESATATLRLVLVGDPSQGLSLVFGGLREAHVPHEQPWGPSVFVNALEYVVGRERGDLAVRIQMQSGDDITLRAASLEIG
jgi:hypothetical protein